ncbi:MAG TPA: nucleotidyltransferase domain-containing protein [Candidatus Nanoarchaeia archaeon]|nr:nucleotidyltransferase domain-containing protein [Candidatus Nanoarchaeia archaeon]
MVQLIRLIGNNKVLKIISFFFSNQTREFSQTELLAKIKIAKATMIKCLKLMQEEKIISMKKIGVTNLYKLNNENTIVKHLKILFSLSELEPIKELSEKHNSKIYLYGSAARGENIESSDIDILVIGAPDKSSLMSDIINISKKLDKEIRVQVSSNQEWSLMARKDPAFYERVEKDKVLL